MATSNPAMNVAVFGRAGFADTQANVMTLGGTAVKTGVLLTILLATAMFTWYQTATGALGMAQGLAAVGGIGGFVLSLVIIFNPKTAPFTSPIYAALEGLVMGAISAVFEHSYPGIVLNAVGLSIGTLLIMLTLYGTGLVRATEKFKIGLISATGAICLVYVVDMVASLFSVRLPYIHESGPIGIGFSVIVVVIAALNLILDFDFIDQGIKRQAPKFMEWYGGFSLLVTLIWMYLEILRLLAKLQSNRN